MLAFLDTEFTDLVIRPRLLSVGLVTELGHGREFYAEVTDSDRIDATSGYGRGAVLPQFGQVADAACSYAELGRRLCAFLGGLVAALHDDEFVDVAYGYHLDWELVDLAIRDCGAAHWASMRRRIRPSNVYAFTGFDAGKVASEAYFRAQALAPVARHHALCDARALRVAFDAATRAAARPGRAAKPRERQAAGVDAA